MNSTMAIGQRTSGRELTALERLTVGLLAGMVPIWPAFQVLDMRALFPPIMIGNVVLGAGIPAFAGRLPVSLRLAEVRNWRDSDNILVRYEVRHAGADGR